MKFFFPDSQDFIDPSFNMVTEERSPHRVRQRDDQYAHEVFTPAPFDGILVSMAIVHGFGMAAGKYSMAQRSRFLYHGVRDFLRIPDHSSLETIGDCGAFSYVRESVPPFGVEEAFEFYEGCGFDYGLSVDHVIPIYRPDIDDAMSQHGIDSGFANWADRQQLTLDTASHFRTLCVNRKSRFEPIGVAQGWSPYSYSRAVSCLQTMGYTFIALGGLVSSTTHDIIAVLQSVSDVLDPTTRVHLLGVTRLDEIRRFARLGVTSFDSTAPLIRAFKDKNKNYFLGNHTFSAISIPQVDGNPRLKRKILAGTVDSADARRKEQHALQLITEFDKERVDIETTLDAILDYQRMSDPDSDRESGYRRVLTERPWARCNCEICTSIGIHVILLRGAERNRRRGFHNLYQFNRSLTSAVTTND